MSQGLALSLLVKKLEIQKTITGRPVSKLADDMAAKTLTICS
jgi:hypothetical protein